MFCGNCRFWDSDHVIQDDTSRCRRHAPRPVHRDKSGDGIGLLAWWYISEHSDEEMANNECENLPSEGRLLDCHVDWPLTIREDWCGEWQPSE